MDNKEKKALLEVGKCLSDVRTARCNFFLNKYLTELIKALETLCKDFNSYTECISIEGLNSVLHLDIEGAEYVRYKNHWIYEKEYKEVESIKNKIEFYILGILPKVDEAKKRK